MCSLIGLGVCLLGMAVCLAVIFSDWPKYKSEDAYDREE